MTVSKNYFNNTGRITPGYFIRKPKFKMLFQLKEQLGFQDAVIQTNQTAIRYLYDSAIKNPSGIENFINEAAKHYNISRGSINIDDILKVSAQAYIVQTHNIFELFIRNLNAEFRELKKIKIEEWRMRKPDKEKLDPFNQLLENLPPQGKKLMKASPETKLVNYYRLVRNSIVHFSNEGLEKANRAFYQLIADHQTYFQTNYPKINAPNYPQAIDFEDYKLLTRSLKYFANFINDACDISVEEVVDVSKKDPLLKSQLKSVIGK